MLENLNFFWTAPTLFFVYKSLGAVSLFYNSIRDLLTGTIDERWNYFMSGAVMCLSLISGVSMRLIVIILFSLGYSFIFKKLSKAGIGDASALFWISWGYFIWSGYGFLVFLGLLSFVTLVSYIAIRAFYGKDKKYPYYPFILLSFILANSIISSILQVS